MPLAAGSKLGPYDIVAPVGAGGMGEVYKARDTRLDRTVAIKVLPTLSQADPDSRERFEREAKLLASLDHPHICALHDVGIEGHINYLVMPFLTGETLSERLRKGLIPLPQVIEIATQIADALDRAHSHGIIHRDLKPGNVMLTRNGVRLLDFGLARLEAPPPAENSDLVRTRSVLTQAGAVMGTLPYMSPEQLAAAHVDARTDVWAFGCVLYEMIAGRVPFRGETSAGLMSAILASTPEPLASSRPDVPGGLDAIVAGALVKDAEERWQSMRDVKRALAMPSAEGGGRTGAAAPDRRALFVGAAAVMTLAAVAMILSALGVFARRAPAASLVRFDVNAPGQGAIPRVTDTRPYFAVSPDGTRVAFRATVDGRNDLWIKRLDADKAERLADTENAWSPFWSPDGQSVAFYADGHLKRKSLGAGNAQTLCETDTQGVNGAWNAAGVILFGDWGTRRIMRVSENGGVPAMVRQGDNPLSWLQFLPDGRHFLYDVLDLKTTTRQLFVGAIDSAETVAVPGVFGRAEFANGYLVFWRDGGIVAQPFDLTTFELTGHAMSIADDVHAFELTGYAALSVSPNLLAYQAGPANSRLVLLDRQGLEVGSVGPLKDYTDIALSPDGSMAAFAARDPRLGTNDIFIDSLDRDIPRQLTSNSGTENGPVWSTDGKTIAYAADRHGPPSLHARNADGSGEERELVPAAAAGPQVTGSFTPDGLSLIFQQPNPGTDYDVMLLPLDGHAPPAAIVKTKGRESSARISRDGRWLAYVSTESGRAEVYVQAFPDGHGRQLVSRDGGSAVRWRGDSQELYFIAGPESNRVMAVALAFEGTQIKPASPRLLFVAHAGVGAYDVTRAGDRFLVLSPDPIAARGTISVIANWTRLLGK